MSAAAVRAIKVVRGPAFSQADVSAVRGVSRSCAEPATIALGPVIAHWAWLAMQYRSPRQPERLSHGFLPFE